MSNLDIFSLQKSSIVLICLPKEKAFSSHLHTTVFLVCVCVSCYEHLMLSAIFTFHFQRFLLSLLMNSPDMYIAFNNLIGLCSVTASGVNQHFFLWFCWLHVYLLYEEVCSPELEWLLSNTQVELCTLQDNVDSATWLLYRWLLKPCISEKPYLSPQSCGSCIN